MRFIATADWQLGMPATFLTDESRPRFKQARLEVIRRIGAVAADRDADFVLVCGDVFDSNQLDRQVLARTFDALRDITVPVYLLPGNHDPLDASSIYASGAFSRDCPDHVRVLDRAGVHEVAPGVEVVAAPWFSKRPVGDPVCSVLDDLQPADGVLRVLAGHGAVDALDPDHANAASIEVARLRRALDDRRVHVVVLGDRHSTTRVDDAIWYAGAPEVTARREVDPGNILVVEVRDPSSAPTVEPVRVGSWRFVTIEHEITGRDDVAELDRRLDAIESKECTGVWLVLSGLVTIADRATLDEVLDRHALVFATVHHVPGHGVVVLPADTDFADLALTGFARAAVDELRAQSSQGDESATVAADALGLLYRLAGADR